MLAAMGHRCADLNFRTHFGLMQVRDRQLQQLIASLSQHSEQSSRPNAITVALAKVATEQAYFADALGSSNAIGTAAQASGKTRPTWPVFTANIVDVAIPPSSRNHAETQTLVDESEENWALTGSRRAIVRERWQRAGAFAACPVCRGGTNWRNTGEYFPNGHVDEVERASDDYSSDNYSSDNYSSDGDSDGVSGYVTTPNQQSRPESNNDAASSCQAVRRLSIMSEEFVEQTVTQVLRRLSLSKLSQRPHDT